jgi:hypothetical protein
MQIAIPRDDDIHDIAAAQLRVASCSALGHHAFTWIRPWLVRELKFLFNSGGVVPFAVLCPRHGSGQEWPFPTGTQPIRGALVGVRFWGINVSWAAGRNRSVRGRYQSSV